MVIEPGFADRDDLGMARAGDQIGDGHVEFFMGVVRMGADRTESCLCHAWNPLR